MRKDFEHIRDQRLLELKYQYFVTQLQVERLTQEVAKPKEMGKQEGLQRLGDAQKRALEYEKDIKRVADFDIKKLKKYDL